MFGMLKKGLQSLGEKLGLSKPKASENLDSKESKFPQDVKSIPEKESILTQEPKPEIKKDEPIFIEPKIEQPISKPIEVKEIQEESIKEIVIPEIKKEKPIVNRNEVLITYFAHGTTKDNEQHKASGWSQIKLSSKGIDESNKLKDLIKDIDFDVVYCSDLERAIETVSIVFEDKDVEANQDERLRECNHGDLNSKDVKLVESNIFDRIQNPFPNGESLKDVEIRIAEFLNFLYSEYRGKHVAIVAHKYTQLAMDVLLKNISWEQAIEDDWRAKNPKAWQPGWNYTIKSKVKVKEEIQKEIVKPIEQQKVVEEPKASENLESEESKSSQVAKSFSQKEAVFAQPKKTELPNEFSQLQKELEQIQEKEIVKPQIKVEEPKKEIKLELSKEEIQETKIEKKVSIFTKLKSIFADKYLLSDSEISELIEQFEMSMLQSDVSLQVCELLTKSLKDKIKKEGVSKSHQEEYLKKLFLDIVFENYPKSLDESFFKQNKKPFTILFVGTNGGGKTTNIAKLAYYLKQHGKSLVLAASDTYRAAAIDQLEGHATKLQVPIIKGKYGQDPASVAYDAVAFAKSKNLDFVLVDSSGRQDNSQSLMKELEKIKKVINPDFTVFVAEAIAGQTALAQAESFNKYINFDAFILTKADVDEKGGTLLSISLGLKKPILFLGVGQEYKDIAFFDKDFLEQVI